MRWNEWEQHVYMNFHPWLQWPWFIASGYGEGHRACMQTAAEAVLFESKLNKLLSALSSGQMSQFGGIWLFAYK